MATAKETTKETAGMRAKMSKRVRASKPAHYAASAPSAAPTPKTAANAFGHTGPYQKVVLRATTAAGKNGAVFGVKEIRAVLTAQENAFCNYTQISGVLRGAGERGEIQKVKNGQYRTTEAQSSLVISRSPHLQIQKKVSLPLRISSIPEYATVSSAAEALADVGLSQEPFSPLDVQDARTRIAQGIVQRQGQPAFRSRLLKAYAYACCITGTDAVPALEAAHIFPYKGVHTNDCSNGLLLRADLHSLFDQGLLSIDEGTMTVVIASALACTSYANLSGVSLRLPKRRADAPSKEALAWHRQQHAI